jgi:HEAT repeat protein
VDSHDETQTFSPAVNRYVHNLKSPNPRQRSHAAAELGDRRVVAAAPHLIDALENDVNTYVRSAAAESLGHIGDRRAIFPLMDALHDPSSFVRRAAAIALGQLQAKEAQGALLQALEDPNFYVRRAAVNAIGKLGIPELGEVLLPLLHTHDPRFQRTVIIALRRLGTREAVAPMIALLEGYLRAPSPHDLPVVKNLIISLGKLRAQEAVPVLMEAIQAYVGGRSLAAKALGQIGDPRAGPVLVEALRDRSNSLRQAALKGIGQLGYAEGAPAVREFLTSPDPRLRRVAATTLGQLRDEESVQALAGVAAEDISPLVRPAAVEALGRVGRPEVLPHLLALTDDTNAYVRASLAQSLVDAGVRKPEVKEALLLLSGDRVTHVAETAGKALEEFELLSSASDDEQESRLTSALERKEEGHSWFRRLLNFVSD